MATDCWKPRNTRTTLKQEKDNDPKDESAAREFHLLIPCKRNRRDDSFVASKGEIGDVEDSIPARGADDGGGLWRRKRRDCARKEHGCDEG